jgi:hypothetical protein
MNAVARRIDKLEERFGTADGKPRILVVVTRGGAGLALDQDTCIEILDGCGFLPARGVGVVDLGKIPNGLNAEGLETFLRENAAEICNFRGARNQSGAVGA